MSEQAIVQAREYHRRREQARQQEREAQRRARYQAVCEAVQRLAPGFAGVQEVYLFGSLVRPARFRPGSDVDVAVVCRDPAEESRFWRALEEALELDVDLRPYAGAVAEAVDTYGERIYERKDPATHPQH